MKHQIISCAVKELQNEYTKISQHAKENPVIVKENEQESMVLLAHQKYYDLMNRLNELEDLIAFYSYLAEPLKDINKNRVEDLNYMV